MINMKDLIKHQTNTIRKESGMNIKEEEKIEEGKADQSFHKIMALLRKESRRLNDDDAYELSTKLKAWFDRHIF